MGSNFQKPVYISIDGETKTLRQWAKDSGIPQATLYSRYKNGVSGKALIRPSYIGVKNGEKRSALKDLWHGRWVYVGT